MQRSCLREELLNKLKQEIKELEKEHVLTEVVLIGRGKNFVTTRSITVEYTKP